MYSEHLDKLKSQIEIVRTRKSELNQLMHDLEQNVEEINRAKGESVTFFISDVTINVRILVKSTAQSKHNILYNI